MSSGLYSESLLTSSPPLIKRRYFFLTEVRKRSGRLLFCAVQALHVIPSSEAAVFHITGSVLLALGRGNGRACTMLAAAVAIFCEAERPHVEI